MNFVIAINLPLSAIEHIKKKDETNKIKKHESSSRRQQILDKS